MKKIVFTSLMVILMMSFVSSCAIHKDPCEGVTQNEKKINKS